jgi:hypothetical protein
MSERQIFCWSEKYDDSFSKHQKDFRIFNKSVEKDFRIFNKSVDEDTYYSRNSEIREIIQNNNDLKLEDFWKSLTDEQISKLSKIPEFDAKGFEYITGRKVILDIYSK